ncbi:hypothetical protein PoB_003032800 [Plakobranchus ocellatus]|uniref:Reverse transcriptase domain-containing protein n=1 Tax=Plakobranchus ocellatus TaxID=259542 RepID=A0AAV4AB46_9GAST|nr:hypothetical protein PoB_003032800 [Plakobranchus ocellatus]
MKHGKATGPDNISVELIEALEDFGIGKVTHLLNEIYDTGQIPTDLSKSIFIALPKKPGKILRSAAPSELFSLGANSKSHHTHTPNIQPYTANMKTCLHYP